VLPASLRQLVAQAIFPCERQPVVQISKINTVYQFGTD